MTEVYLLTNDGGLCILVVPKDDFDIYFEVFNENKCVKSRRGVFISNDYYENLDTFNYGNNELKILGYYYLHDNTV